jgi:hypothetical protein
MNVGQVPGRLIDWAAGVVGIPADVVAAQISEESGGDPAAVSPTGAEGVAQFEPGTWSGLGCAGNPHDVNAAMRCYATYMYQLLRQEHGNVRDALAAYNAGPGNLQAGYGYADTILANAGQPSNLAGKGGTGPSGAGPQPAGGSQNTCLFGFPGVNLPVIGNAGSFCLFPKHTARAWIGAGIMGVAVFGLAMPALALIIVDVGLKGAAVLAGPASATGRAVSFVNPAAGSALTAAGGAMRSGRRSRQERPATETVTVRERTPISGEMGGTRDTTRTVRGPAARREIESRPARGRHARR